MRSRCVPLAALTMALAASAAAGTSRAAPYDPSLFAELGWRMVGPFRGGRTVAAVGVPRSPGLFYIGVNDGGIWKTTDYGRVWRPIFDAESTGSIGALAIAPSDPRVIYAGSGEGLQRPDLSVGDGIYRSDDAGATWRHLGLRDGRQIPALAVDPRNPRRVFAAVLGHPYGPNSERGVYRSTDGGEHWTRVLHRDENTGAMDVVLDPSNPQVVFADLWSARQAPWESGFALPGNNGLYKSTDGGTTWRRIRGGLPDSADGLGRIGLGTCASASARMYAIVGARRGGGLYRSDDRGEHWRLVNPDERLWGRDGDFDEVKVDPKNADVVYVANIVTWKSTDGGRTFTGWRGAPGGDDYHRLWIDPERPSVILIASDQGAVVTVNGGETWSSWYNQPTAQMFHVNTDDAFPYRIFGGQQESGSVGIASRGPDGAITFRDWHPVGAEEYGYVVPDPLHKNWIFGGKLQRYDLATGQTREVTPVPLRDTRHRFVRTAPIAFSPADPHVLYYAGNIVFRTTDGGEHWTEISPDLTREHPAVPATVGAFAAQDPEKGTHRGVVYALAPSPLQRGLLWAGTDDGLIWVTRDDGRHWSDVTPPVLTPWSKVSILEASHHDRQVAFAAVNRFRLDDLAPHVYRTRDGGRTWNEIVNGIPGNEPVNVVREDPVRKGLLFAGTQRTVYVSFDEGDHWQSLRLNLPPSSMRDLAIHGSDLVVATHGRSFWVLDDFTPLRQIAEASAARAPYLFAPATAWRVRWNRYTDTPLPPDEPVAKNPPDGAVIDYFLPSASSGPVLLEILDGRGGVVRRSSSTDTAVVDSGLNVPEYWIRPFQRPLPTAGMHRFVWDLHGEPPPTLNPGYPISAVAHDTWREPRGPFALPGNYTVRLTVNGTSVGRPLVVRMDPTVPTPAADLAKEYELATRLAAAMNRNHRTLGALRALRARVAEAAVRLPKGAAADSLAAFDRRLDALESGGGRRGVPGLRGNAGDLASLLGDVDRVDAAPTPAALAAADTLEHDLTTLETRWEEALRRDLPEIQSQLRGAGLPALRTD